MDFHDSHEEMTAKIRATLDKFTTRCRDSGIGQRETLALASMVVPMSEMLSEMAASMIAADQSTAEQRVAVFRGVGLALRQMYIDLLSSCHRLLYDGLDIWSVGFSHEELLKLQSLDVCKVTVNHKLITIPSPIEVGTFVLTIIEAVLDAALDRRAIDMVRDLKSPERLIFYSRPTMTYWQDDHKVDRFIPSTVLLIKNVDGSKFDMHDFSQLYLDLGADNSKVRIIDNGNLNLKSFSIATAEDTPTFLTIPG